MSDRPRKRQATRSNNNAASTSNSEANVPSVESLDSQFGGDEDYALKRQRNNAAVNKTRQKKRQEEADTVKRVRQLREENAALEKTVESLRQELAILKEMVLSFASKRDGSSSNPDGPPPIS